MGPVALGGGEVFPFFGEGIALGEAVAFLIVGGELVLGLGVAEVGGFLEPLEAFLKGGVKGVLAAKEEEVWKLEVCADGEPGLCGGGLVVLLVVFGEGEDGLGVGGLGGNEEVMLGEGGGDQGVIPSEGEEAEVMVSGGVVLGGGFTEEGEAVVAVGGGTEAVDLHPAEGGKGAEVAFFCGEGGAEVDFLRVGDAGGFGLMAEPLGPLVEGFGVGLVEGEAEVALGFGEIPRDALTEAEHRGIEGLGAGIAGVCGSLQELEGGGDIARDAVCAEVAEGELYLGGGVGLGRGLLKEGGPGGEEASGVLLGLGEGALVKGLGAVAEVVPDDAGGDEEEKDDEGGEDGAEDAAGAPVMDGDEVAALDSGDVSGGEGCGGGVEGGRWEVAAGGWALRLGAGMNDGAVRDGRRGGCAGLVEEGGQGLGSVHAGCPA